jgi:uncharacterized protein (TIGR03435 family)
LSAQHGIFRSIQTSLRFLILGAYGLQDFQISGGPAWMSSEWYDVIAKAEDPDGKDMTSMIRCLLAERFALRVHRETKEQTVFELVVSKGGLKIRESAPDTIYSMRNGMGSMTAIAMPMSIFVTWLSGTARHPVIDKTGLSGAYDFKLEWTDDGTAADGSRAPLVQTAIQEQLGLKLESRKGPVDILVIDHAERPTEN